MNTARWAAFANQPVRVMTPATRVVASFAMTGFRRLRRALSTVVLMSIAFLSATARGGNAVAPSVAAEPSISSVALEGNVLTGNRGQWNGSTPITYANAWLRCDAGAANCVAIAGATADKYTLTAVDIGSTVRFQVTATNGDGSTPAKSNPTAVVSTPSGAPVNSKPPTVSGSPAVGPQVTALTGTWVGATPITYSYLWQQCDTAGNACSAIPGATSSGYEVGKGDVGRTLRVKVTGKNSKGKSSALSDATAEVKGSTTGGGGAAGDIIVLPGGAKSAPVADVPAQERLIVDKVTFSPATVSSRKSSIEIRVRVMDTRGYVIRGAFVFVRSTPIVTSTPTDAKTGTDGWVTYRVTPESDFPLKNGYSVQFYVKAYRAADPSLAGVYGSRLVQVPTVAP